MLKLTSTLRQKIPITFTQLQLLYAFGLFLALHAAIPMYANSGFLEALLNERTVGIVFSLASFCTLIVLLNLPRLLIRFGVYKTTAFLVVLDILALSVLASSKAVWLLIGTFVLHFLIARSLFYLLDLFVENLSVPERTGTIRGVLLTVLNAAFFLSPFILSFILGSGDRYPLMYLAGGVLLIPALFILIYGFKNFKDPIYEKVEARKTTLHILEDKDLFNIFAAGFLLRFFFAWMVIYTPIYLINTIGFDWSVLGQIFTFMLLPFVLFQIPLGAIADKYIGEKELLALGFIIMGGATMFLSFVTTPSVVLWALLLFTTRVGASFVEIMTESYFFKQVDPKDSNVVALYRTVEPVAYIAAPIVSTLTLIVIDIRYTFIVLGAIMLTGVIYALGLKDSK